MSDISLNTNSVSKPVNFGIWTAQLLGAAAYILPGVMKTTTPIPELAAMMPWAGEYPEAFVRGMGIIDLAGGLGLLLPSLTRIAPRLTPIAAIACIILQFFAIAFHGSRGEFEALPINTIYILLPIIILWGRGRKAPITSRFA